MAVKRVNEANRPQPVYLNDKIENKINDMCNTYGGYYDDCVTTINKLDDEMRFRTYGLATDISSKDIKSLLKDIENYLDDLFDDVDIVECFREYDNAYRIVITAKRYYFSKYRTDIDDYNDENLSSI